MRVRERESEALQIEKRKVAAPVCWFLKVVSLSLSSLSLSRISYPEKSKISKSQNNRIRI